MNLLRETLLQFLSPDLVEEVTALRGHLYHQFPTHSYASFLLQPQGDILGPAQNDELFGGTWIPPKNNSLIIHDFLSFNVEKSYRIRLSSLEVDEWTGYPVVWNRQRTISLCPTRTLVVREGSQTRLFLLSDLGGHIDDLFVTKKGVFLTYVNGGPRTCRYLHLKGPFSFQEKKTWLYQPDLPLHYKETDLDRTIFALAISPNGTSLALDLGEEIKIFSLITGRKHHRRVMSDTMFSHTSFSPNGEYLLYRGPKDTLVLRHLESDRDLVLETPEKILTAFWDGNRLLGGSPSGKIYQWTPRKGAGVSLFFELTEAVSQLAYCDPFLVVQAGSRTAIDVYLV